MPPGALSIYEFDPPKENTLMSSFVTPNFNTLIEEYLRLVRPNLDITSPESVSGKGDGVSSELFYLLESRGVESSLIQGVGLKPPMGKNASKNLLGLLGLTPSDQKYFCHVVVKVGAQVIDLTGAQFDVGMQAVMPLPQFKSYWNKVKPFQPWVLSDKLRSILDETKTP